MEVKLLTHFISNAKFCRPCGLGFAAESDLPSEDARTLGLLISEILSGIYPPQFLQVARALNLSLSHVPSLADLGVLVHAEATKEHGVRVLCGLPGWLEPFQRGLRLAFSVVLAPALAQFVEEYAPELPWLRSFSFNDPHFKSEVEVRRSMALRFTPLWISTDGCEKLRMMNVELLYSQLMCDGQIEDTARLISELLSVAGSSVPGEDGILDVNDGSIVTGIGRVRSRPTSSHFDYDFA